MADFDAIENTLAVELLDTRTRLDWTREQAVARLQEPISPRTLIAYEMERRRLTVRRLLDLSQAYKMSSPWLLSEAIRKAGQDPKCCSSCGHAL
jgi:hypothetical protein